MRRDIDKALQIRPQRVFAYTKSLKTFGHLETYYRGFWMFFLHKNNVSIVSQTALVVSHNHPAALLTLPSNFQRQD